MDFVTVNGIPMGKQYLFDSADRYCLMDARIDEVNFGVIYNLSVICDNTNRFY